MLYIDIFEKVITHMNLIYKTN